MSVPLHRRELSQYEYVRAFLELYAEAEYRIAETSKRRKRWIGDPIMSQLNEIYDDIMTMSDEYYKYGINLKSNSEKALFVINKLVNLQKPLFSFWNISDYDERRMNILASKVNEVIKQLANMGGIDNSDLRYSVFIIDKDKSEELEFLKNMKLLHKFIHSKVTSMPVRYANTKGKLIMDLSDEALLHVFEANRKYPTTIEMYEDRKIHIESALNCLRNMETPIFSLFVLRDYTNDAMEQWARLINKEEALLTGLLKSDEKQFNYLFS